MTSRTGAIFLTLALGTACSQSNDGSSDSPSESAGTSPNASSDDESGGAEDPNSDVAAATGGSSGGETDTGSGGTTDDDTPPGPGTSPCDPEALVVDTLEALVPYLDDDDANIALAPGTYHIDTTVVEELFPTTPILNVTGSNSSYCFTGVTIEFDTEILQAYGNVGVVELSIEGENNALKNLTMVDIGDTRPTRTALAIHDNGRGNLIEGFHLTIRGSEPYGYGDIFGKGSGYAIKHFKHSGILLTGDDVHLKDITIIHRAYGHGIFMQGALGVLMEGIYMEGELRSTDEVLAEVGTAAADRDFLTVWGFPLQPGYQFSLQEDGIRAYRNAPNGRISSDMTILDSTVKFMRSGVTIGLGEGEHHVENVTALGNESGFWAGSGANILNCRGDTSVGPLYLDDRNKARNTVDLTIVDNVVPKVGNTASIHIAGNNHNFTLRDGTTEPDPDIVIQMGGTRYSHRDDGTGFTTPITNSTIDNQTNYPVVIGGQSSDNDVTSCGEVTDGGTGNTVMAGGSCP